MSTITSGSSLYSFRTCRCGAPMAREYDKGVRLVWRCSSCGRARR